MGVLSLTYWDGSLPGDCMIALESSSIANWIPTYFLPLTLASRAMAIDRHFVPNARYTRTMANSDERPLLLSYINHDSHVEIVRTSMINDVIWR